LKWNDALAQIINRHPLAFILITLPFFPFTIALLAAGGDPLADMME